MVPGDSPEAIWEHSLVIDLGQSGGIGDTVDFSSVSTGLEIALGSEGQVYSFNHAFGFYDLTGVENVIGTLGDDRFDGNDSTNIVEGLSGTNSYWGHDGGDKYVVGAAGSTDHVYDNSNDSRLYIRDASGDLMPLIGGFTPVSILAQAGYFPLTPDRAAYFNPAKVVSPANFHTGFNPNMTPLTSDVENSVFIKYSLAAPSGGRSSLDLTIEITRLLSNGANDVSEVIVHDYQDGQLGLKFKELIEPNYSVAAATTPMETIISVYENAHLEGLNVAEEFHISSYDLWAA
ncbi:hypothetical protein SAMN05216588_1072 [Pseudomonas flavescens]|uniref:Uncharacterized protein n=2 Tax=Phytopseudomonas flavescens TaxID=29435 RepID=A0A1G8EUP0_9GAMM|nr:hypothetical protein SAMN05216588_1072 [Pseudomonas flavescens]